MPRPSRSRHRSPTSPPWRARRARRRAAWRRPSSARPGRAGRAAACRGRVRGGRECERRPADELRNGRSVRVLGGTRRRGRDDTSGPMTLDRAAATTPSQRRYAGGVSDGPLLTAELLSIGSELTVGDTRDTNAGEIARSLTREGVAVGRLTALPDRLDLVSGAFADGLARADLVVSTGGLGPTPDDLTREAIAAVCGETPAVDADLGAWVRELWARREIPFPEANLKQAWRIPSAEPLPNPNGTAPGWFVVRPGGHVIVALPGPPREMRPMWSDEVLPRLRAIGLGADVASRTYRLMGIGESQVAGILRDELLRRSNPEVATYARAEAVDVRVSAGGGVEADGSARTAEEIVEAAAAIVEQRLGQHVWATGEVTWSDAIGELLTGLGWRLAVVEIGTGGQ